jgi:hypothetical protein
MRAKPLSRFCFRAQRRLAASMPGTKYRDLIEAIIVFLGLARSPRAGR